MYFGVRWLVVFVVVATFLSYPEKCTPSAYDWFYPAGAILASQGCYS